MGRCAKPLALKTGEISKEELEKRKANEEMLQPKSSIPLEPPDFLMLNYYGKRFWKIIAEEMPEGLLSGVDVFVLGEVCYALQMMHQCKKEIKENGMLVEYINSRGQSYKDQNKACLVHQKYLEAFNKLGSRCGLSPADRAKLSALNIQEDNSDELLMKALRGEDI